MSLKQKKNILYRGCFQKVSDFNFLAKTNAALANSFGSVLILPFQRMSEYLRAGRSISIWLLRPEYRHVERARRTFFFKQEDQKHRADILH